MTRKEHLQRVALTLPETLLQRLDGQVDADRQTDRRLDRTALIRRAISFYLDNRVAVKAERLTFAQGVEARLTAHQREQTLVSLALYYVLVQARNLPKESSDAAWQWAAQNVDHIAKLLPPPKTK